MKKIPALFVAVVIALLPFRFGHALSGSAMALNHSLADRGGLACDHSRGTHAFHQCAEHAHDGACSDDCCGDQCSGAQVLAATDLDLCFSPSREFNHPWFEPVPDALAFTKYRPPIFSS